MTLVAEIGDFRRFATASELMAYVGLVPSEHTTGESRRQGGDHPHRQHPCATNRDRVGLALPPPAADDQGDAREKRGGDRRGADDRLEGAEAIARASEEACRLGKAPEPGGGGGGAGAGGFPLGDRPEEVILDEVDSYMKRENAYRPKESWRAAGEADGVCTVGGILDPPLGRCMDEPHART